MTMADIWLTAAARATLQRLPAAQAAAVRSAIDDITTEPGQRIDLPSAPPAEPFLAKEPRDPDAPAVIYRRTTPDEPGDWRVVSLMNRSDYRAARRAEQQLTNYPPAVRELVNAVVAGTVATITTAAPSGNVTINPPQTGEAAPTTSETFSRVDRTHPGEKPPRASRHAEPADVEFPGPDPGIRDFYDNSETRGIRERRNPPAEDQPAEITPNDRPENP
jgi:hypothetical protein